MRQISTYNGWLTRLVLSKSDSLEIIIKKKFFLRVNFIAVFFLSCLTVLSFLLHLKNFTGYSLLLVSCNVILTLLLLFLKKWSKWFVYTAFSLYVVLIFYIILRLGGLANSAGLLMAAYFFLLTSQWMEDTRLLFWIGLLYIMGVLVAGISYPYLNADLNLQGWKNNLFFAINFGWIGILLAVALDSTIVKSENDARNRVKELQDYDLLKSRLYTNIAHEFRTPLTLIRGNAQEIIECHDDETFEQANSIVRNSDKILFLVNQMLNLSKVEEGGVSLHYVQGDLVAFVRFVVNSFQGYADSRETGLHYQSSCLELMMDLDAEKLEESLSNLLSNAIKYTPAGGNVYVTVREPARGDKQVEISVLDTGIGIPEDQLDKIFIRFYRIEDKRYPSQEGTGIGLTLVNEYIKLMKGSIRVRSTPGKGSEFVMTLPVTHNAQTGDVIPLKGTWPHIEVTDLPKPEPEIFDGDQPRLLIIEDNQELIGYLAGLLSCEYQVITAKDGIQGIELAIANIPDIILSDVMMPGKDGYQVCKELKNDFRTNHIPIVLLTARADTDSRITGLEQGSDAYLTKPFDRKELKACLHNLFVQREVLRIKYRTGLYQRPQETINKGLNEKFLERVLNCLEKNYRNDRYGIVNLYTDMGISRVQLHRKLIAITGQSASNFIRSFRLQKARKVLRETEKNISEVAFLVGFGDSNYFSKTFIQEFGLTATEYRNSLKYFQE